MKSIIILGLLTILFLGVNLEKKIKLLLISIFILPFFYNLFGILPNSVKLITDIYLLLFLFEIISSKKLMDVIRYNKVTKYTFIYMLVFTFIFIFSGIVNGSNIFLSLLEYRRIVFPLFFLFVLNYYSILKNQIYKFEPFLKLVFILQFILIPLQYIFYDYYIDYLIDFKNRIDSASGTFGQGTSIMGVFIVSYFMYYYIINRQNVKSFLYLLPLPFIFSGGGNLILLSSFVLNIFTQSKNVSRIFKISIGIVIGIILMQILSIYVFKENVLSNSVNYIEQYFIKRKVGGIHYINPSNNKLDRFHGPAYVALQLKSSNKEIFGFGNDVYATSRTLEINKNKFNLNEVINLVPELMMKYGYLGLIINLIFYLWLLIYFYQNRKKNIFYQASLILVFITLLSFMYTKPIYQRVFLSFIFFIFHKAELISKK